MIGAAALGFSLLYFATDLIEVAQGGFSDWQLWLTLLAEIAIPFFVVGLYLVQRPKIGLSGAIGAGVYAYVYAFFTYTVIYAIVKDTPDFEALDDALAPWMLIHGVLMVVAGLMFGAATLRAKVLPGGSAVLLMVGVVAVAATNAAPDGLQLVAAALRDGGFAWMGLALLSGARE